MVRSKLKISSFFPVLLLSCVLVEYNGRTDADRTETKATEEIDGVAVTVQSVNSTTLLVEWTSKFLNLKEPHIFYKAVQAYTDVHYVDQNSEEGLISPVYIANLHVDTLYEIVFSSPVNHHNSVTVNLVASTGCNSDSIVLSRRRRVVNLCIPNPCLNNGACFLDDLDEEFGYFCVCPAGFLGHNCDQEMDVCDSSSCQNGGNCTDGFPSFTCECREGYSGDQCEIENDPCDPNPCQNGATCQPDGLLQYTCVCTEDFEGSNCELLKPFCERVDPCLNGGTCVDYGRYGICQCPPGYLPPICEATGTCKVWGDPHYITFDELKYDYQGDCEYTLVESCQGADTPSFELIGDNLRRRPSLPVSYLRLLRLVYQGTEYTLKRNFEVMVDGLTVTPPYQSENVTIRFSYGVLILSTNFGLSIQYDGTSFAKIELLFTLFNQTCGLCGTFDGDDQNDLRKRDGTLVSDVNSFGESWMTGTRECQPVPEPPDPCTEGSSELDKARELCSILQDKYGPFSACNSMLDSRPYYESCIYDLCVTLPEEDLLCDSLAVYADACQAAGFTPENWRDTAAQCSFACPGGTVYDPCGTACPASCAEPSGPSSCPFTCVETCRCPDGQVLDGDNCVDLSSCGCIDGNGNYHSSGDSFLTDDCSQLCDCTGGSVECQSYNCDENAECTIRNGIRGCYCQQGYRGDGLQCKEAPAVCQVYGDPHYITFDGRPFDFQGACEYTLIGDCTHDSIDFPFELTGINRKRRPSSKVAYLEEVILKYNEKTYALRKGGEVRVDGDAFTLPYLNNSEVNIFYSYPAMILETTFGLTVRYDGRHNAEIEISKELYQNMTCGLCGTLDGNAGNDFRNPDGDLATSASNFGNGWETGDTVCTPDPGPLDPCSEDSDIYLAAQDLCYILIYLDGPFSSCHAYVDPEPYYEACVYDTCATYPDREPSCDSFEIYDNACRIAGGQPGEWRSDAPQCSFTCPGDKVYDSCAVACPETCPGQESNLNCSFDCVETCRCPDGQLLDGTQCVDSDDCGCWYSGIYLSAGESFVPSDCSERCTCMAGNTVCEPMSCGEFASCEVRNGKRDCYCYHGFSWDGEKCSRAPAICTAWGDPHYTTFDGQKYDFQGDCEYTMVEECTNNSFFEVIADNVKIKPSDPVAYVREARLLYKDSVYQVKVRGEVLVNGTRRTLPYEDAAGVTILYQLPFIAMVTDFGLTVRYDGIYTLHIAVDYQLYDKVCGLCGTFNDSTDDDFQMRNGLVVASPSDFGNSWETGDQECTPDPGPINPCVEGSSILQSAQDLCFELKRKTGVFSYCHDFIDPEPSFGTCVYDLCVTLPDEGLVCSNFQQYADACRVAGGNPGNWRDAVPACAINCPEGSHYTECGTACPTTCLDPNAEVNCTRPCVETCQCNEGLVLDGSACVPPSQCGCVVPGRGYISSGDSFLLDDCSQLCECTGGTVECQSYNCDENSECTIRNGIRGCYCQQGYRGDGFQCEEAPAVCQVYGDPHYITFDGRPFDFQGACEYILIGDCTHDSIDFPFELTGINRKRRPSSKVAYLEEVILKYNEKTYALRKGGEVRVDGDTFTLPYLNNSEVNIFYSYPGMILETTFGLTVRYNADSNAEIEISKELYQNMTCGLCGTLDGNADNDFRNPGGDLATSASNFGNSWETGDTVCAPDPGPINPCSEDSDIFQDAQDLCYILIYIDGPFSSCHAYVDPEPYYEACVYDTCATYPDREPSCDSFEIYDNACRIAGVQPGEWRSDAPQCSFTCPGDKVYDSCAVACPETCPGQESNLNCSFDCVETCRCPDGQLLDGSQCVDPDDCGCWYSGIYLSAGESFVPSDCSERCTCMAGNTVCEPMSCGEFASCEVRNGKRDCYCYHGFSWDGEKCSRAPAICTAWGDPHYTTFDGQKYDFQGDCEYTMVEECANNSFFEVIADNVKIKPSDPVAYVREVRLLYKDSVYQVKVRGEVLVNGTRRTLPYEDAAGVTILYQLPFIAMVTDFGLTVRYDGIYTLHIAVDYQLYDKVCGLCGTFNDSTDDDFQMRNGLVVASPSDFGNSWETGDQECTPDPGPINPCVEGSSILQSAQDLCFELKRKTGVFSYCHDFIDPEPSFGTCVYDLCVTLPDEGLVCSNFQQYADACRVAGGNPGNWRDAVPACAINCPEGSHYTECGTACPTTCLDPNAEVNCTRPCVETCQCNEGLVLDGSACVPPSQCGCVVPGRGYISSGDSFLLDDCSQLCECTGGTVECQSYNCDENSECTIRNGIRGCYCQQGYRGDGFQCEEAPAVCQVYGDPHYITFDGRPFDFQGACEYILIGDCTHDSIDFPFELTGINRKRRPSSKVAYLEEVILKYNEKTYALRKGGEVRVDGDTFTLPYLNNSEVNIFYSYPGMILETTFGLTVRYNADSNAEIEISKELYQNMTCGLCGTLDGNADNDFRNPGGDLATSASNFGNSWETGDTVCAPDPGPINPCSEDSDIFQDAQDLCYILIYIDGPFSSCHAYVDPEPYYEACVYDTCATYPDREPSCDSFEIYDNACRIAGVQPGEWRSDAPQCSFTCPGDKVYDSCAVACPETCPGQESNLNCSFDCVETCRCPDGQLLDDSQCVDPDDCGCWYSGIYLSAGESFVPSDCSERCTCMAGNTVCEPMSCGEFASCEVRNGKRDCYCYHGFSWDGEKCSRAPAICTAWGDPHYTTFDGQKYDFQGDCEYTMVEECANNSFFEVIADNVKIKPSDPVAYVREVRLLYKDSVYQVKVRGEVLVNGTRRTLPYEDAAGVTILYQLPFIAMVTDFGLTVRYDGIYTLHIAVDYQLYDKVCGLCGTFNDSTDDDFQMRNGLVVASPSDFGNSWETGDQECTPDPGPINPCVEGSSILQSAQDLCFELKRKTGVFSYCHDFIDPEPSFGTCVYDLCVTLPDEGLVCSNFQQYADACRVAGGNPGNWRDAVPACAINCPEGSHYTECGTACPTTCLDPNAEVNCTRPCVETCQCNEGLVLDGSACVPPSQCGCVVPGRGYISSGDSFLLDDCSQLCECTGGTVECQSYNCDENSECTIRNGIRGCYCQQGYRGDGFQCEEAPAVCQVYGDPHYITFDGRPFDFQGACEYILIGDCTHDSIDFPFELTGINRKRRPSSKVAYLEEVILKYNEKTYALRKGGEVRVDGDTFTLPYLNNSEVNIFYSYPGMILETTFGLTVRYNADSNAEIEISKELYQNMTCGLCGTLDGNADNDFRNPGGDLATSASNFGNSWETGDTVCTPDPGPINPCSEDSDIFQDAQDLCYILIYIDGPFSSCHAYVDPEPYYEACVYDTCATYPDREPSCDSFEIYDNACRIAGVQPGEWRSDAPQCSFTCPGDKVYDSCAAACPETCPGQESSLNCSFDCVETCRCPDGQLLDGTQCVDPDDCGCWYSGIYLSAGESFVPSDCSERCTCMAGNTVCEPMSCGEFASCEVRNGKRDCYCYHGFSWDGEKCSRAPAICTAWGDPHYTTFDGQKYDFQGDCEYTMVEECANNSFFEVIADNVKIKPSDPVAYVREARLLYKDSVYQVKVGGEVLVNGTRRTLPYEDAAGVTILYQLPFIAMVTDFGLTVRYDGIYTLHIAVDYQLYDKVCGLCGTFNDSTDDDFQMRNGLVVASPSDFGNSWETGDQECTPDPGPINPCVEGSSTLQSAQDLCFELKRKTGVFSTCHDFIDPEFYFGTCVYDLCVTLPDEDLVCSNFEQYADACRVAGGNPGNWRDAVPACAINCPASSHYTECGTACPTTCLDPNAEVNCTRPCVETCQCNEGLVLDGSACVPPSQCGCVVPGRGYISNGDSFLLDDCSQLCECTGGTVECQSYNCDENSECTIRNGIRGCYCQQGYRGDGFQCEEAPAVCQVYGDPHYITFDGRPFDFQGACEYILIGDCTHDSIDFPFELTGINKKRRPSSKVTFLEEVILRYNEKTYALRKGGEVRVDDITYTLPYLNNSDVYIFFSYPGVILETTFGLTVRYNARSNAEIEVSKELYQNMTCGLCGTLDGNAGNDFRNPDGDLATSASNFGNSWETGDTVCTPDPGPINPCSEDSDILQAAQDLCYILIYIDGPFSSCHEFVDPEPYYDACVYDTCATHPDRNPSCDSFEIYDKTCQIAGGQPGEWRSDAPQCSFTCPGDKVYDSCATACPETCPGQDFNRSCSFDCVETCRCPDGQLLDGTQCVNPEDCGCWDTGIYLSANESFVRTNCTERCTCVAGSTVCEPMSCDEFASCEVRNGKRDCYCYHGFSWDGENCTRVSTCRVFGDPHYHSFDGRIFDYMGSCEYKLASDCKSDVTMFEVRAENRINPNTSVATVMSVTVTIRSMVIFLENNGGVTVNDVLVTLPFFVSGVVKIRRAGGFTVVQTEFDVVIMYDHQSYISISVSDSFLGNMCGLCGNNNGQTEDDFTGALGTVQSIQNFGNSYITNPGDCNDLAVPVPNPCLNATAEVNSKANQLCNILQDESGIFSACIMAKPTVAQAYYDNCRFDVCGTFPAEEDACSVIQAFAILCREDDFNIGNWRNESICPVTCPQNSTFDANGDPCPESCTSLLVPSFLNDCDASTTVEGCQCDPGFVLEGSECVLPTSCGCVLNGFYAPVGLTFQTSDCQQECTCNGYGNLTCVNITCDMNALCTSDGCMCMEGYKGDGLSCQELCLEGEFTCQDGSCISDSFVCDLFPNCPDFDDEAELLCCNQRGSQDHCPKPGYFRCPAEGLYIPVSYLCDGYTYDCSDNYDESDELCSDLCFPPPSVSSGYFTPVMNLYRSNDVVMYYCSADHTLVGNDTRSCNGFDFGNAYFPECYRDCNLPSAPPFSTFNNTDNTHGSVISLVCDSFYELETPGSYLFCSNGTLFGNLSACILIDQCTSDPCKNGGTCLNNIGSFNCLCTPQWTGATCETNVDECLGENDCHQNATCVDNEGSYTCLCNEDFTGDGFYCREIRLFPYGDDCMDERLTLTAETADKGGGDRDKISRTFVPPAGFPIGDDFYYSLYFIDNGLVVFINENAEKFAFPNPYPEGFDGSQSVAIVAPFWTDSSLANEQGEVFYQVYERSESCTANQTQVLDDADNRIRNFDSEHQQFNTSWLLVITWFEIPSFTSTSDTNTFQVGLATDGTFSFALFNYEQDEMLWNTAALASTNLIIGYNTGSGMYANTQLDKPPFNSVADKFTPDQFLGNTGLGGRWIYRLEANSNTTLNPKQYCLDWYNEEPPHESWSQRLGICPCTFDQGTRDGSYRTPRNRRRVSAADENDIRFGDETLTAIQNKLDSPDSSWLQSSMSPRGSLAGMSCSYQGDGSLVEGYGSTLESSFVERYQFRFGRDRNVVLLLAYLFFDIYPRKACCELSSDPYFCDLYAEKRPAGSCRNYRPNRRSACVGDPHFTTLDGYQYTFNGLGDYQVALIYSDGEVVYDIQGRTKQIVNEKTGELADATYFDAYAFLYGNSSEMSFILNENGTDFNITENGEEFNKTALLEGEIAGEGYVLSAVDDDLTKVMVVFVDMSAVIQLSVGVLDIVVQLPEKYKGNNTRGLIGVWNGNVSDDFVFPDDTLLQPSGTDGNYTEEDFFNFGEAWKVSAENSLFDSIISRRRREVANMSGFQPKFLSNLISDFETEDPAFLSSARSTCGGDEGCLFDTLAAESEALGAATKETQEANRENQRISDNFPPNITADSTIIATLGELFYYQVDAVDPEGETVSYSLLFDNITANVSSDGLVVWNPVSLDQISLIVQASDGEAFSAVQPTIIICNCQNNGTCQENVFTEDSDVVDNKFAIATCACTEAWTGNFCEEDFNACLDDPCFPGISCFDNEAPLTGNRCGDGTCPEGLIGDGFKCYDLDECVAYANRSAADGGPACEQICENTLNGFTCSCDSGYNLHPDMYQCIDIDECELQTDECSDQADCSNTPGSYNCTCQDGYLDVNGDGRDCQDINECLSVPAVCDSRAECTNTNGSFICTCNTGFEGDGKTCEDINECTRNLDNCDGNAECADTVGSFSCSCRDGWSGDGVNCTNINECLDENLRECHPRATCEDNEGSYICFCPPGFFGDGVTCEDINECELGQSDCAILDNSELCINTAGSYECICNEGFTSNGTDCIDVDECNVFNATQCSENANCTNTLGSYSCSCQDGYAGNGITCMDVDECQTGDDDCNPDIGACSNTDGSYSCICITGYEGDGRNCTDIDECTTDSDDCNQICNNFIGGFFCSCYSGYELDPAEPNVCLDMDECLLNIDNCTQGCNNTAGSYNCYCYEGFIEQANGECIPEVNCIVDKCINGQCYLDQGNETCMCYNGYELSPQNDTLCVDIDECGDSSSNMCDQICNNIVGDYQCDCNSGYRLAANNRLCEDIDECAESTDNCDLATSTCVNEPGTFRCACNSGFMRNGSVCQDVNECLGVNDCSTNADCNNTVGSYQCSCKEGYMGDGYTCVDFDECSVSGQCYMFATCTNTVGSFSCECNFGLKGDGFVCMDIDECNVTSSSYANCSANAVCTNDVGSFTCTCVDGFEGDGRTCVDVNECSLLTSDPRAANCDPDATCTNVEGSFMCACNGGYNGNGTFCEDIDECDGANSCVVNSTCANLPGSYRCTCNSGFRGDALVLCEDIEECVENLDGCDGNAECRNFIGGYSCDCNTGFNGTGFTCSDIDECLSSDLTECHPLADCSNTVGSYVCTCQTGLVSTDIPAGRNCEDFNECMLDPCGANEECINTFGSIYCTCIDGYERVNETCVDINECITRPCENVTNARCENTIGGYNCICQTGFYSVDDTCSVAAKAYSVGAVFTDIKGVNVNEYLYTPEFQDDKKPLLQSDLTRLFNMSSLRDFLGITISVCSLGDEGVDITFIVYLISDTNVTEEDVEVAFLRGLVGRDNNIVDPDSVLLLDAVLVGEPIYNPCGEQTDNCTTNAECIFLGNSYNYTCQCNEGFMGDGIVSCNDINECEGDPCIEEGEVCVNTDGSYTCECENESGYFKEGDMCVLYTAFQGEFSVLEVNTDPALAVFLEAYRDPTTLEFSILESRVCGTVLYSYIFIPKLKQYYVDCFVDSFAPGSIQTVWTVLFNLGVDTTASELKMILLDSIVEEMGEDGVLVTGTESLGNLTLLINTIDLDAIVPPCPEDYCYNNATCSVIQGAYVCNCTDGYLGSRCGIPPTTQSLVETTTSKGTTRPVLVTTARSTTSIVATTRPRPVTTERFTTSSVATTQKEAVETTSEEISSMMTSDIPPSSTEEPEDEMIDWQVVAVIIVGIVLLFLMFICCFCCCICENLKYAGKHHHYPVTHNPYHPDPAVLHNLSTSQRLAREGSLHPTRPYYHGQNYGYDSEDDSSSFSEDAVDDYVRESENRLRRLAQGISHSPYLNEHMRGRVYRTHPRGPSTTQETQFIRPYMASGQQEFTRQPNENPFYDNPPRRASAPPPQESGANPTPMTQFYPSHYY